MTTLYIITDGGNGILNGVRLALSKEVALAQFHEATENDYSDWADPLAVYYDSLNPKVEYVDAMTGEPNVLPIVDDYDLVRIYKVWITEAPTISDLKLTEPIRSIADL